MKKDNKQRAAQAAETAEATQAEAQASAAQAAQTQQASQAQTDAKAPATEGPEMVSVERAKLEEASKQFEQAQAQRDEYLLLAKKVQAEFDNYRKRNATLRVDAEDEAVRQCVLAMLPTLDNLERALGAAEGDSALKTGVEMTLRGMREALAKLGMEGVPCERGSVFDPEMYNAVMTCEASEDCPAGSVAEVFQTGYQVRGKIVRYAMVKVAQ